MQVGYPVEFGPVHAVQEGLVKGNIVHNSCRQVAVSVGWVLFRGEGVESH